MNCRVCASRLGYSFASAQLLGRQVQYFDCSKCGYLQTEEPSWLDESYSSPINSSDTGIMVRNIRNVGLVLATQLLIGTRSGQVVDYAGGYGFLVRMLRDKGLDALWADPYSSNLVARGFEYSTRSESPSLVTAFEAFEHFVDPNREIDNMLSIAPNILFTTSIVPSPTPGPSEWWYYGLDHGQHIGFFRLQTLKMIAASRSLYLLTDGKSTHLLTSKKQSKVLWMLLRAIARVNSQILAIGLRSRTWSDHCSIVQENSAN
jgi:hypothetical protein